MKKIFTLIAAVVSAMSVGAKDFTDNLHLTVMGNDLNSESTITVDKVEGSDDTYDITLNDFSFDTFPLGDIKIEGVKGETAPDGMVSFEETTTSVTVSLGNASVTINEGSRMKGDKLYLDMTIVALGVINVTAVFGDDNFPKAYTDDLTVTFMGEASAPQPTTIFVETQADGKYTLSLNNFKFGTMGVGNVVLTDVEGTDNGGVVNLSAEQTIKITEGDDPDVTTWLGPILGDVPVSLKAKMSEDKLYAEITINMMGGINVVFGTDDFTTGIDHVTTTPDNGEEAIYDLSGRRLNEMQKGINIVRKADGTTVKVLKK